MTDFDAQPQPAAVAQEYVVDRDVSCVGCGYNLRTLSSVGACPECGAPVATSLHANALWAADTRWLSTVRSGITWYLWSILVAVLVSLVAAAWGAMWAARSGGAPAQGAAAPPLPMPLQVTVTTTLLGVIAAAISVVAVARMTTAEPGAATDAPSGSLRTTMRLLVIIYAILTLLTGAVQFGGSGLPETVLTVVSTALGTALLVCISIYLRRLVRRVPDERTLERSTTTLIWGLGVGGGAVTLAMPFMLTSPVFSGASAVGTGRPTTALIVYGCGVIASLVFAISYILFVIALFKYRAMLERMIRIANSAPTAPGLSLR